MKTDKKELINRVVWHITESFWLKLVGKLRDLIAKLSLNNVYREQNKCIVGTKSFWLIHNKPVVIVITNIKIASALVDRKTTREVKFTISSILPLKFPEKRSIGGKQRDFVVVADIDRIDGVVNGNTEWKREVTLSSSLLPKLTNKSALGGELLHSMVTTISDINHPFAVDGYAAWPLELSGLHSTNSKLV